MARPFKKDINFLVHRRTYLIVSGLLVVATVALVLLRGMSLGIEFGGGSSLQFTDTGEVTISEMRSALSGAKVPGPVVQTTYNLRTGTKGFIVRTPVADTEEASKLGGAVLEELGLAPEQLDVSPLGPSWDLDRMLSALIVLAVALLAAVIWIAFRFEYKMGISACIALLHTLIVAVGLFSLLGLDITPSVAAALIAVAWYSLYDATVVFRRVNDNITRMGNHSFMTVANHTINQALMRTINSTLVLLVPMLAMLAFSSSLRGFAIAMSVGLLLVPYSTIAVASPIYALWKQREPKFRKLLEKYGEGMDSFLPSEQLGE